MPADFLPLKIRPFTADDINAILEVQRLCQSVAVWQYRDYMQLAEDPGGLVLVACREDRAMPRVLGFSAFHRIDSEAELRNIAVTPEYRRQGIAKALLEDAFRRLYAAGVQRLFLEVRESNFPAIELYRKFDFAPHARRKGYYQHPTEDALVLVRQLIPSKDCPDG